MPARGTISRRTFINSSGIAGTAPAAPEPAERPRPLVIDCHSHLTHHSSTTYRDRDRRPIEAADKLGSDKLCCSVFTPRRPATAVAFRACNTMVAEGMRRFPGRILGYCCVNSGCGRDAHEEILRCVEDRAFIGMKLYNEHVCTDPVVYPIT